MDAHDIILGHEESDRIVASADLSPRGSESFGAQGLWLVGLFWTVIVILVGARVAAFDEVASAARSGLSQLAAWGASLPL